MPFFETVVKVPFAPRRMPRVAIFVLLGFLALGGAVEVARLRGERRVFLENEAGTHAVNPQCQLAQATINSHATSGNIQMARDLHARLSAQCPGLTLPAGAPSAAPAPAAPAAPGALPSRLPATCPEGKATLAAWEKSVNVNSSPIIKSQFELLKAEYKEKCEWCVPEKCATAKKQVIVCLSKGLPAQTCLDQAFP